MKQFKAIFQNIVQIIFRSSLMEMHFKIGVVRNFTIFTGRHLCCSFFFNKISVLQLYYKKTPTQVFTCEYSEVFINSYFDRTPPVAAFEFFRTHFLQTTSGGYLCLKQFLGAV